MRTARISLMQSHGLDSYQQRIKVRALLQENCKHHLLTSSACSIQTLAGGAPRLIDSDFNVSLSHDIGWISVGTSAVPLGIDIQQEDNLSSSFIRRMRATSARTACQAWSVREAISKLRFRGLADAPWNYSLSHMAASSGTFEESYWHSLTIRDDVFLSIATYEPIDILVQEVPNDDLTGSAH